MFSEGKWNLQGMDADIPPKHPYVINVPQDEQRARKFFTTMLGGQPLEEYKKEHGSSE
jgi:IS4 transposase